MVHGVDAAIAACETDPEVAVIGGGEIYQLLWPIVNRLYLTEVDMHAEATRSFPPSTRKSGGKSRARAQPRPERQRAFILRVLDRVNKN